MITVPAGCVIHFVWKKTTYVYYIIYIYIYIYIYINIAVYSQELFTQDEWLYL